MRGVGQELDLRDEKLQRQGEASIEFARRVKRRRVAELSFVCVGMATVLLLGLAVAGLSVNQAASTSLDQLAGVRATQDAYAYVVWGG